MLAIIVALIVLIAFQGKKIEALNK